MSLDKSLKSASTLGRHRNVLTRAERIASLQETGLWTDESRPIGLPKVAHRMVSVGKKIKEEKKDEEGEESTDTPEEKKD
ncbi:MAG: small basic protein [Planctomycetes bacterium]|nr:small basic protein [Planctomycetota bacterium]